MPKSKKIRVKTRQGEVMQVEKRYINDKGNFVAARKGADEQPALVAESLLVLTCLGQGKLIKINSKAGKRG